MLKHLLLVCIVLLFTCSFIVAEGDAVVTAYLSYPSYSKTLVVEEHNEEEAVTLYAKVEAVEWSKVNAIVEEINKLRANPTAYADNVLSKYISDYKNDNHFCPQSKKGSCIVTIEGVKAVNDAINMLKKTKPLNPLTAMPKLVECAQTFAEAQGASGLTGSTFKGFTAATRLASYGSVTGSFSENIIYGFDSPTDIVAMQLINDGAKAKPQRRALLNAAFKTIGVGVASHKVFKTEVVLYFASNWKDK